MAKNNNKGKITRSPINTTNTWFKNVIKSMGYTSIDLIKDIAPATSDFVETNNDVSMNIINAMRGKVTQEKFMDRTMDQVSPLVKMSSQGLKNALEDIKTGNFYNKEREQQYLDNVTSELENDMFGDFEDEDFDFGGDFDDDEFDDSDMFVEDDEKSSKPKVQPVKVVNDTSKPSDFIPAAQMITGSSAQNTMVTVKSIQSLGKQQKAFQIQSLMRDEEYNNRLFGSLASINDNLSSVLKIKTENESKFISVGMEFFGTQIEKMDELIKYQKGDDRTPEEIKDDIRAKDNKEDIFMASGVLDVEAYLKNIKQNIMDIDELSMLFDSVSDLTDDEDMMQQLIAKPLVGVIKGSMKSLIPNIAKQSIKLFDDTVASVFPAMIAKINKLEDADLDDDGLGSMIKSFAGKIFGYNIEKKKSANLGRYEKGPVPFDGVTRKTIVDIIPSYLRRIESAITGTNERFYDYDRGKFTTLNEIEKSYNYALKEREMSGYNDIVRSISKSLDNLNMNSEHRQSFEDDLFEYFRTMNDEGASINPFTYINKDGDTVDELDDRGLFMDEENKQLFRRLLSEMDNIDLMKMMGSNIFDSIKNRTNFFKEIEKDPTKYNYKYLHDNSIVENDYIEDILTNKKKRKKLFSDKDKYGNTSLNYLRDIKSILLNGIRVFVTNDYPQSDDNSSDPRIRMSDINEDYRRDMHDEEEELRTRTRRENRLDQTNENRRTLREIINMNDTDFNNERRRYETDNSIRDYLNDLVTLPSNNPLVRLRNKLSEGIISVTEGPAEKFNDMVYKLIFGSDEYDPTIEDSGDFFDRFKTKISAFHTWAITSVYTPVKESLIGENGIITKISQSKLFRKLTDKKNDIIDYLFGTKNDAGLRQGGFLSGIYNKSKDMIKSIGHYFTGNSYIDSEGNIIPDDENSLFRKGKRFVTEKFNQGKEKLSNIPGDFMEGYHKFREAIFGKAAESGFTKQNMQDFAEDIKAKLPKAIGTGIITGIGKGLLFSKAGLLGSLFLPGGAIGAMITGTAASFLMQSDKFKNWLFGEKDPEDPNKRLGGFIPKSLQDLYSENKQQIKIGGAIGAGVGFLPSFFLPGGPLTGAILGITAGMVTKSDAFQEFLYGENFKDGNKSLMNGAFGKAFAKGKEVFDKYGVDPKQATFLGGIGAVAGGLGLLPTFFLPGGPIGGALLGMAGGIVASSNKFQEFLLGEKQWDGKRHGGLITKFSTWFDIHVVDSLKITMKEWNMKVSDFLYDSIAEPFLKAVGPVNRAMQDAAEKVKDVFKAGWDKVNENIIGTFKDNVIKPFGESLEKFIVNPLKKFLNKSFSLVGKILGTIVSAPFKLFGFIGNRLDKKNEKNAVKDEKEKRRSEAYQNIKNDIKSGNFSFRDIRQNIRNAKISKEEREELIKEATSYRDKYEQGKEARDAKRAERRERLQSEIDEMKSNQQKDAQFFRRNGKFRNQAAEDKWNQQQKEKQAWYQQHIAESGMETVEKLDEINKAMKDLQDSPRILSSMEEGLLNELRELKRVMEEQLDYFKKEGFVDTSYLRRKSNKPEPVNTNIHFNMNDSITSKPEVSPMFKNVNNISNEAKKKQDPRVNNIIDILRRNGQSHAEGLDIVPYDGYVAELHKGERIVPGDESQSIGVASEKEKFKMLNSIKRHTRIVADEIKGQLYGVGSNLHNIRKILQHMSGLKNDDVANIKDQNIPDGGWFGKFIHNTKVKMGSPLEAVKNTLMKPFNVITDGLNSIKNGFVSVFNSVKEIPGKIVDHVGTAMNTVLTGVADGISIALKGAAHIAVKVTDTAIAGVSTVVSDLYKGGRFLVTTISKSFVPVLQGAGKAVGSFAQGIGKAGGLAIEAVTGFGKGVYTVTKDIVSFGYNIVKDVVKGGAGVVKTLFGGGMKFTGNVFGAATTAFGKKSKEPKEVKIVGGILDEISKVTSVEEIRVINNDVINEKIKSNIDDKIGVLSETSKTIDSINTLGNIKDVVKVKIVNTEDIGQVTSSTIGDTINKVTDSNTKVVNAIVGKADSDTKNAYKDQIKEQMKAEKQKEKEEEAKADRAHVSRLSADYVQEQKRVKKEQLLDTQYKQETMKDIDSTDKTLTKQYDFWYKLFGKNGTIHTKLKNMWEWAKKLLPMLLNWFKGTGLFNTLTKIFGGTGLGNLAGSIATALAPSIVATIADNIDKKEREEREDKYNISEYDAYVGEGKESRYDGKDYVLNGDRISAKYNVYGRSAIKLAKNDTVKNAVTVGKNIYSNAKPYLEKATSKITETGGNLINSIKSKLGFGKTVTNTAETGMSVVNFGTSEILDDAGKVISEGKYRVIDVADDVAKNNEKLFAKLLTKGKDAIVKLVEYVGSKLGNTKLGAKGVEIAGKILSKLKGSSSKIMAKFGSKIATFFGEKVAGMITLGVVEAGLALWNAGTGLTKGDTANLFGVKTDQVDWKMRAISAALKTVTNLSWIGVIYLINEILADVFDINLLRWLAGLIYKVVASVKDSEELSSNQEDMKSDWKEYNEKNGTNMSFEAYVDKQSPTTADKIVNNDWFKNLKGTFDKGAAANALGKNKDDVNLWDRIKFGFGHTGNNILNLFRKDKKTDAEYFQGAEQLLDEKGNAILDENGNPQYKSVKKETDKKHNTKDDGAGYGPGGGDELDAIENGFNQEAESTSNWLNRKTTEHKSLISTIAAGFNTAKATVMGWYTSNDDSISKTFKKKKSKININDRRLWGQLKAFNWAANLFRDDENKLSTEEEAENIMKHFKDIGDSMSNWLKAKTENIKKIIDAVGKGFASVRNKFTNWWTGNDATIAENKNKDPEDVNNWDRMTDKIVTGGKNAWNWLTGIFKKTPDTNEDVSTINNRFNSINNGGTIINNTGTETTDSTTTNNEEVPAYAQGTSWVPDTQIALIHEGEMVIPADKNPMNPDNFIPYSKMITDVMKDNEGVSTEKLTDTNKQDEEEKDTTLEDGIKADTINVKMNKKSNLNVYGLEDVFERLIKESEKNNKYTNQDNKNNQDSNQNNTDESSDDNGAFVPEVPEVPDTTEDTTEDSTSNSAVPDTSNYVDTSTSESTNNNAVVDDTAYDTSDYTNETVYIDDENETKTTVIHEPAKISAFDKVKSQIERFLPKDKNGNTISGDPINQQGYYTSYYMTTKNKPSKDPTKDNALVTSKILQKEADKKAEEEKKRIEKVNSTGNSTGAQIQRDINRIMSIPIVNKGMNLLKEITSVNGTGRELVPNSLIPQENNNKTPKNTQTKETPKNTQTKETPKNTNKNNIINPLGVFSIFGDINKSMSTNNGRDITNNNNKNTVDKSFKDFIDDGKKSINNIKKSWGEALNSENSQVREMFDIYDKDKNPSIGQKILYQLTKPITDASNALQGKNTISYGGGGHMVRDKFATVEDVNSKLGKNEKDRTRNTVTEQDNAFTRFIKKTQDIASDINKGLKRTDKDKTNNTVTKQDNAFTRFIEETQNVVADVNSKLGMSNKDKNKNTVTKQDNAFTRVIDKIGKTFNDVNKSLGKNDKDKTNNTVTEQDNAFTRFIKKTQDVVADVNSKLGMSDKNKNKNNVTKQDNALTKIVDKIGKTFGDVNKSLGGSDRLTEGKLKPENTKIKKSIQNVGNAISNGVGTVVKTFKQFNNGLNKTSKDLDKVTMKDESNPIKTTINKIGKRMSDGIKGIVEGYNGFLNNMDSTSKKYDKKYKEKTGVDNTPNNNARINTDPRGERINTSNTKNNKNNKNKKDTNPKTNNPDKSNTNKNKNTKKKTQPKKQSLWTKIKNGVKSFFGFGSEYIKPLDQQVKPKNYVFSDLDYEYMGDNRGQNYEGLRDIGNTHNYAYYSQLDERWSENKLGKKNTLGVAGCGPTSAAMILTEMTGQRITPDTMAQIGTKYLDGYTSEGYFPEIASQFKLNYDKIESQDIAKIKEALKNNKGVVLSGVNKSSSMINPFTKEGHIVVATGITGDKIQINDPRGPGYSGEYRITDVMRSLNKGFVLSGTEDTMKLKLPSSGKYGMGKSKVEGKYQPVDAADKVRLAKEEFEEKYKDSHIMKAWKRVTSITKKVVDKVTGKDKKDDTSKETDSKTKKKLSLKDKLTDTVKKGTEKIKEGAKKLLDKAKDGAKKIVDKGKELLDKGKKKTGELYNKGKEKVGDLLNKGKKLLGFGGEEVDELNQWYDNEYNDILGYGGTDTIPLKSQVKAKNYVFDNDEKYDDNKGKRVGGLRDVGNTHDFAYYSQLDERWSNDKSIGGNTIGEAGCGPTSAAMVLTEITGQRITPDTMAQIGNDYLPGYASYSYFPEVATKFKLNYSEIQPEEESTLRQTLQNKKPVILSGFNRSDSISSPYTKQGHIVVATGIKGGNVQINDPRGPGYSGEYKLNDIIRGMKRGIVLSATRDTMKTGLPSSGEYSKVYANDEYIMSEDTPDFDGLSEIFGTAGTKTVSNIPGAKIATNKNDDKTKENNTDDKKTKNNTDDKKTKNNTGGKIKLWEKVLGYAKAFLGKLKYVYGSGAIDNNGMTTDCSHFTAHVVNRAAELNIPPGSAYQKSVGTSVTKPQAGDLVVWTGHAGLVADSNGNMIDAGSGTVPKFRSYEASSYWRSRQNKTFRRVLSDPNKLVDPKVKNYHKGIGFNGIVGSQGGNDLEGGSPGSDNTGDSTTDTSSSSGGSSAIPELGVFDKLSQGFTNIVASMYNGQQVDLFANNGSTDDGSTPGTDDGTTPGGQTPTGTGNFPTYKLNDAQIKGLANILDHEQPGTKGIYAEASIMANLNDIRGDQMATTENLLKRAVYGGSWGGINLPKGWFAYAVRRFENPGNPSKTAIQAIKDVIIGGKRTLPRYVDEHDCFSDITSVTNNGAAFNKTNRSAYKPHVTKFRNRWNATGTFYSFPGPGTDPFFYTSDSYRKKWGENCYSIGGGSTSSNDNGAGMGPSDILDKNTDFTIFPEEEMNAGMGSGSTDNYDDTFIYNKNYYKDLTDQFGENAGGASDTYDDTFIYNKNYYKDLTDQFGENAGMGPSNSLVSDIPATVNNYAYYCQRDAKWNKDKVGIQWIADGGCGPSSVAIIATQLTRKVITPRAIAKAAYPKHWARCAQWSLFDWFGQKFGLTTKTIPYNDLNGIKSELKAGHPVIASTKFTRDPQFKTERDQRHATPYTPGGHIIPFIGVDSENKLIVNDPQTLSYAHAYDDKYLAGKHYMMRQAWSYAGTPKVPSDIEVSGNYSGPSGTVTNAVTNNGEGGTPVTGDGSTPGTDGTTGESAAPAIPELGVFEKLSQGFSNIIASMYNGSQVDLFSNSGSTGNDTDTTTPSDGSTPDIGDMDNSDVNARKKAVWTFFTGAGYSKEATAGIMGNMHTETGGTYSPSMIQNNGRGPAAGICQWENYNTKSERWKEMSDHAKSKGKEWTDMQSQLEFIDMELAGRSKDTYTNTVLKKKVGGYEQYKQLNDVEKAVMAFEQSFERAGVKAYSRRIQAGKDNYNQFANAGTGFGNDAVIDYTRIAIENEDNNNDWTYYDQSDPQWNNISYGGNTIESAGCGPTSLAMAASDITGDSITPEDVAIEAYKDGVWTDSSSWDIFPWFAKKMNFEYSSVGENDISGISKMLRKGEKVVVSGISTAKDSPFTKSGHIVTIVGQTNNGNFIVHDPRGKKYSGIYRPDQLIGDETLLRGAWGYKQKPNTKDNKSDITKQMTSKELYANAGKGSDNKTTNNIPKVTIPGLIIEPRFYNPQVSTPGFIVDPKDKSPQASAPGFVVNPKDKKPQDSDDYFVPDLVFKAPQASAPGFIVNPKDKAPQASAPGFVVDPKDKAPQASAPGFVVDPKDKAPQASAPGFVVDPKDKAPQASAPGFVVDPKDKKPQASAPGFVVNPKDKKPQASAPGFVVDPKDKKPQASVPGFVVNPKDKKPQDSDDYFVPDLVFKAPQASAPGFISNPKDKAPQASAPGFVVDPKNKKPQASAPGFISNPKDKTNKAVKEINDLDKIKTPKEITKIIDNGDYNTLKTSSEINYVKSCLEMLNVAVNELKSININTKETSNNISKIKIYSANEPVKNVTQTDNKIDNNKNNKYNKSKTISSHESNEYYIARKIASFKK